MADLSLHVNKVYSNEKPVIELQIDIDNVTLILIGC